MIGVKCVVTLVIRTHTTLVGPGCRMGLLSLFALRAWLHFTFDLVNFSPVIGALLSVLGAPRGGSGPRECPRRSLAHGESFSF